MTKQKSTKRALLLSVLSLLMCVSMLIGTTFAWFTDSVTSAGNIIKAGTLDVEMYWADGKNDPANATWTDASSGAMFTENVLWEPGYTEARHVKIANVGSLALKYQMRILANGVVSKLANVIDVYYFDEATQLDRTKIANATKLGTLSEVLNNANEKAISANIAGSLEANTEKVVTIAFKMQESAGNEYQGLAIGADFSIQLLATQYTSESDSFNNLYDADAGFAPQKTPAAMVYQFDEQRTENIKIIDMNKNSVGTGLDTAYSFLPTENYDQAIASEYSWAHADFYVYADTDVPANSIMLAGYYSLFGDFLGIDNNTWIGLTADTEVSAGEANGVRLLRDGMSGISVAYNEICEYGNDGTGFLCGAKDVTGDNAGTTLTVELRLYEVKCDDPGCHHNNMDCETGKYITVGTFTHTFPGEVVYTSTELVDALAKGRGVVLANDITLDTAIVVDDYANIDLNGHTLLTTGFELKQGGSVKDGTVASNGDTYLTPHLKISGGTLRMDDVTVDVTDHLNANVYWSEATGMEVANAKAVLNNCDVKIHNETKAQWVYSYGISLNSAELTVNGGSITATCVAGTAANGPTNPNAISTMGECSATLNNVNVTATYYATTVQGHLTLNTTDKTVTSSNIVDNNGGSHTLNYID